MKGASKAEKLQSDLKLEEENKRLKEIIRNVDKRIKT